MAFGGMERSRQGNTASGVSSNVRQKQAKMTVNRGSIRKAERYKRCAKLQQNQDNDQFERFSFARRIELKADSLTTSFHALGECLQTEHKAYNIFKSCI
jgi:hypothetical protein